MPISNNNNNEDDDQNFIKKDDLEEAKSNEENDLETKQTNASQNPSSPEIGLLGKIKNTIFPKNKKLRSLDHEVGGLEENKIKTSSKDIWDERSEEVDKMGSTNVFNSTGMRSIIWRKKKEKLEAVKDAISAHRANQKGKNQKGEASADIGIGLMAQDQSFVAKMQLKKELRHDNHRGGGGISF
jgi:hypothetical protein